MPGNSCSVMICTNSSRKAKQSGENLKFFTFPKDRGLRKEWIKKCYRQDPFDCTHKRVCSKHFKPEDYEDEMQARLMGIQPKKLKSNAIPSLYLDVPNSIENNDIKLSSRTGRVQSRQKKPLLENFSEKSNGFTDKCKIRAPVKSRNRDTAIVNITDEPSGSKDNDHKILKWQLQILQEENKKMKKKIMILERNEKMLKKKLLKHKGS